MRQVVLDTETTGLEPERGHRIIEIGCVEVVNRRATGRHFHEYLNPEREIDAGAAAVHGMTLEKLADKPRFHEVAGRLLEFIDGAELVIHNAPFDLAFLDAEMTLWAKLTGGDPIRVRTRCGVLDTLALAREMHPGQRNGLDALCKRYSIDNSHRQLHGALLDARILLDVYLAMTGGQSALALDEAVRVAAPVKSVTVVGVPVTGAPLRVIEATADERQAHEELMKLISKASGGKALWQ
ncbi:MAG TPA: DNA polymerase III subunit epsilon [Steroidobacteraceae bacterium]|nr:DNA polymerase III subunit epsilon [Steroidobacteraceae bacterium]